MSPSVYSWKSFWETSERLIGCTCLVVVMLGGMEEEASKGRREGRREEVRKRGCEEEGGGRTLMLIRFLSDTNTCGGCELVRWTDGMVVW